MNEARETAPKSRRLPVRLRFARGTADGLEELHPSYFALVMATGIVSIGLTLHGVPILPTVLFWLNVVFFGVLLIATVLRMLRYPGAFLADVQSHSRGVGFFTLVAATAVFGNQLLLQMHQAGLATVFWVTAVVLLLIMTYGLLTVLTVQAEKPGIAEGLNGGWLLLVVAPQSVSILTVLLLSSGAFDDQAAALTFMALALWLGGGALYMWLMTLIFYRYTFVRMSPEDLTPPYWISMGAVAISTLAGVTLLEHLMLTPIVAELAAFIKGITLFFWVIGCWWIPMLVMLGVWRYLIRGVPFSYDPLYWGGVFPLGMFSVCTYRLAEVMDYPFLTPISTAFMVIALIAWATAFIGMVHSQLHRGSASLTA